MQPPAYNITTDFSADEAAALAGRSTVRTANLDTEFANIETTLDALCTNIALLQRDDGALHDAIVTTESLAPTVKTLFGAGGITPRGAWLTATAYAVRDVVETLAPLVSYICVVAHVSGVFAADRAAGKWMVLGAEPGVGNFTSITLSTGGITLGTNNTQDLAATGNRFRDGWFGRTVSAALSVATPLLTTTGAVNLGLGTNGATQWAMVAANGDLVPGDNVSSIGGAANRIKQVFTPIIDSGTVGSLSLRAGNGIQVLRLDYAAAAVNFLTVQPAITGGKVIVYGNGSDVDVGIQIGAKGAASINFPTDILVTAANQFEVLHTAGASRHATITGSNGGAPVLDVTAGTSIKINPNIVLGQAVSKIIPGVTSLSLRNNADAADNLIIVDAGDVTVRASLAVAGTGNPATLGSLRTAYGGGNSVLVSRNNTNTANITLINTNTINGVADIVQIGLAGSTGVVWKTRSGAGAPTNVDLGPGECAVWRDTAGLTTKVYYNNGGAIIASAAFA